MTARVTVGGFWLNTGRPSEQSTQVAEPDGANVPAGQVVHSTAPAPLDVPAGQAWHEAEPVVDAKLPGGQAEHVAAPIPLNDPAAQNAHDADLAGENVPAAHTAHTLALVAPMSVLDVPAGQERQSAADPAPGFGP
jgi:hypothetical protein